MDFELSEENRIFQDAIREFAQKEIAPLVDEAEETVAAENTSVSGRVPDTLVTKAEDSNMEISEEDHEVEEKSSPDIIDDKLAETHVSESGQEDVNEQQDEEVKSDTEELEPEITAVPKQKDDDSKPQQVADVRPRNSDQKKPKIFVPPRAPDDPGPEPLDPDEAQTPLARFRTGPAKA